METLEIPEGKYLGTLCKRGHDWEGTGKSLRRMNTKACLICEKHNRKIYYDKNIIKMREKQNICRKKAVKELQDCYVREKVKRQFNNQILIAEIPQELVEAERIILKIKRKLKEKEGQNA